MHFSVQANLEYNVKQMSAKFQYRTHPLLFEINTAAWLFELSNRLGKTIHLGSVPAREWDKIQALGMDFVWLMGVWSRSQEGRKISLNSPEFRAQFEEVLPNSRDEDIIGSCYSISSYGPDPLIGSWEDLDSAHAELKKRGIGLILDFVPNHTGIDNFWLAQHPQYYIQGTETDYQKDKEAFFPVKNGRRTLYIAHGRDPNFPPWTDTAQLNYFNPAVRLAMIDRIQDISLHCEGLRCDMAMLILNDVFKRVWGWANHDHKYQMPQQEFWSQAVAAAPGLVYLAEAYWDTEWTLQQLGFDFVYDKRLYDRLRHNPPREVFLHLKADLAYQNKLVRFIENHDEPRSSTAFGPDLLPANAALFAGLPGLKLFFQGQMEGRQVRLPIQIRQAKTEKLDPAVSAFYDKLLPVIAENIYHYGMWRLKEVFAHTDRSNENLISYLWKSGGELRLTIVNLSGEISCGRVCFQDDVDEELVYRLEEVFSGQSSNTHGKIMAHPGLIFELTAGQALIYRISPTV
jgi:hypothetical protein